MSNHVCTRNPALTIFFTVCLARRGSTLLTDHIDALRAAVRSTKAERPFRIDAWVTLPDHLHCVWTLPPGDHDYSTRWSIIKARMSQALPDLPRRASHVTRREKGLWQRRFWEHHVRGPQERAHLIRYCHLNPVKHGLVTRAEAWRYSSIHRENLARISQSCGLIVPEGEPPGPADLLMA